MAFQPVGLLAAFNSCRLSMLRASVVGGVQNRACGPEAVLTTFPEHSLHDFLLLQKEPQKVLFSSWAV